MLDVTIFDPASVVFQGRVRSVILPGESGTFEVLPFHKRTVSRLITGDIEVDGTAFPIFRGLACMDGNRLTVVFEPQPENLQGAAA